jgi:hypothetical protein
MKWVHARAGALLLTVAALAACAVTSTASATGEPQISGGAIDATDRFVATWVLAPETSFASLEFSSTPIPNPMLPASFAGRNLIDSVCAPPPASCTAPPTLTVFRATDRVARDRRYYFKVNARDAKGRTRTSPVWVLDARKPLRPGGGKPSDTPTNTPVLGQPYIAPRRRTIPTPQLILPAPPQTITGVLRYGVRARVLCPKVACYALVGLSLGKTALVFSDTTIRPSGRDTFALRPRPARRARLARRKRAKLTVQAEIIQPGGKTTSITKSLRVRR